MASKINGIIAEFLECDKFSVELYYKFIEKYGKEVILRAFRKILLNTDNISNIYDKFYVVFISLELQDMDINKSNLDKLVNKYGEDKFNQYILEMVEFNNTDKEEKIIYDKINKCMELLNEQYDDISLDDTSDDNYINFYDDSVKAYLVEISKHPLLTPEEEKELSFKAKLGNQQAKDILAERNLRLVVSIARKHICKGIDFLDLIQEGNIGLLRAVERFDVSKGYKFSTYATWWIKQNIMRAISDHARTIRIPVHMWDLLNKIKKIQKRYNVQFNRDATPSELAQILNTSIKKIEEAIKIQDDPISYDVSCTGDDDVFIIDMIADTKSNGEEFYKGACKDALEHCLATLTEREAEVLKLRNGWGNGRTYKLEEIGKMYGVTRERVRQIENKALRKMRLPSRAKYIKDFYE